MNESFLFYLLTTTNDCAILKTEREVRTMTSKHYTKDRQIREAIIKQIGLGEEVATFEIDRGHRNGAELHTVTTTGIIIIRNKRTNKLITKLIARPSQISRYFSIQTNEVRELMKIAQKHKEMGYNEM